MMPIRLDPNERTLVDLYYGREPHFTFDRNTLLATTVVLTAFVALGVLVAHQRVEQLQGITTPEPPPVISLFQRMPPKPPPPEPEASQPKVTPRSPVSVPTTLPVDPILAPPVPDMVQTQPVEGPAPLASPFDNFTPTPPANPAPPSPPRTVLNPQWLAKPTAAQMARAFPTRPLRLGVSGRAELQCAVTASGGLAGCSVVSETPGGYGFGEAALKMSSLFRMKPATVDGQTLEGALVKIPVVFNYQD